MFLQFVVILCAILSLGLLIWEKRWGSGAKAALTIKIPNAPGWGPDHEESQTLNHFLEKLWHITSCVAQTPHVHTIRGATVVTLFGEQPDKVLEVALPFLQEASLPVGTKVTPASRTTRLADN